jgi:hypothetical protein
VVEAAAWRGVFADCDDLPVGSVKSNVGHLLTAAGGAGLLKVLGAMRARVRPPSLSADDPITAFDGTPLRLLAEQEDWPGPRRCAVSAFGFGGTNAHLIVDEWVPGADLPAARPTRRPDAAVAITAIGARVADGDDADDFRRAILLGERHLGPRSSIDVRLDGLRLPRATWRSRTRSTCSCSKRPGRGPGRVAPRTDHGHRRHGRRSRWRDTRRRAGTSQSRSSVVRPCSARCRTPWQTGSTCS